VTGDVTVVIADDHAVVRKGLRLLVAAAAGVLVQTRVVDRDRRPAGEHDEALAVLVEHA
jgi:DNA-binding NarL/FixJ family response regulator